MHLSLFYGTVMDGPREVSAGWEAANRGLSVLELKMTWMNENVYHHLSVRLPCKAQLGGLLVK